MLSSGRARWAKSPARWDTHWPNVWSNASATQGDADKPKWQFEDNLHEDIVTEAKLLLSDPLREMAGANDCFYVSCWQLFGWADPGKALACVRELMSTGTSKIGSFTISASDNLMKCELPTGFLSGRSLARRWAAWIMIASLAETWKTLKIRNDLPSTKGIRVKKTHYNDIRTTGLFNFDSLLSVVDWLPEDYTTGVSKLRTHETTVKSMRRYLITIDSKYLAKAIGVDTRSYSNSDHTIFTDTLSISDDEPSENLELSTVTFYLPVTKATGSSENELVPHEVKMTLKDFLYYATEIALYVIK